MVKEAEFEELADVTTYATKPLKYSIVFARPSWRGPLGSQPRSSLARVMSGLRRMDSSSNSQFITCETLSLAC